MQKDNQTSQSGLIVSYFGNSVAVEAEDGQIFQCYLHRNQELPVVGDKVTWTLERGEQGIITTILPRHSLLVRGGPHGQTKPLAANVDLIMIVMAPPPIFSSYLVDRYLAAAELQHISPMLVLNKKDLLQEAALDEAKKALAVYADIGCPVVLTSIYMKDTIQTLADMIKQKTAVLVGPSGVGKSSLITALGSEAAIRIGDVSTKGAGKHTTTATRLYHLPQGGYLIDSPGVREFNLWSINKQEIFQCFREFQPFLHQCQFRDCDHMSEPGCVVQAAVADGKIHAERYASYQTFMKQAKNDKKKSHT